MGLFSKKDKVKEGDKSADKKHPDLLNPTPTAPPPNQLKQDVNTSPAQQHSQSNSWHDSTYQSYNGSNISEEPMIRKQQEQRLQNQPPGTTVTTTTTTTTTVTTVTSDGRTQTQVHPYNPITDPPVRTSETTNGDDTSRTSTFGESSTGNTLSNPNSANNVPQSQSHTQTSTATQQLGPGQNRPEIQRTVTPGRKPTPQEMQADSHVNIIPPTPQGSMSSKGPQPLSPTTAGGRVIPARSEKRVSPRGSFGNSGYVEPGPDFLPEGPVSPGPPMRSEKRNSIDRGLNVAPLKTSGSPSRPNSRPVSAGYGQPVEQPRSSYEAPPIVPPKDADVYSKRREAESNFDHTQVHPAERDNHNSTYNPGNYTPVGGVNNSYDPLSPTAVAHDSRSHTPTNYSRPGPTVTSPSRTTFDAPPTSMSAMHPPTHDAPQVPGNTTTVTSDGHTQQAGQKHAYRQSFTQTIKGIQGASDVLRGTINSGIAKGTRDKEEAERQRSIREKGLAEYKASGLQERMGGWGGRVPVGEKADGTRRLRKRSLSRNGVHGSEGAGGLEAVEERSISSQ